MGLVGRGLGLLALLNQCLDVLGAGVAVLEQLGLLSDEELIRLGSYRRVDNLNDIQTIVGRISPVFSLNLS